MKKIHNLQIDVSDMPTAESVRSFVVNGEPGATFILHVIENGTLKYYNFIDGAFELGNSNNTNLKITLALGGRYNNKIVFPSGGGTYTIKLLALPGTEIQEGSSKIVVSKSISKASSNTTITFTAATANTSNYATFPTSTVTGATTHKKTFDFDWNIVNASTDGGGFGLRLTSTPVIVKESD